MQHGRTLFRLFTFLFLFVPLVVFGQDENLKLEKRTRLSEDGFQTVFTGTRRAPQQSGNWRLASPRFEGTDEAETSEPAAGPWDGPFVKEEYTGEKGPVTAFYVTEDTADDSRRRSGHLISQLGDPAYQLTDLSNTWYERRGKRIVIIRGGTEKERKSIRKAAWKGNDTPIDERAWLGDTGGKRAAESPFFYWYRTKDANASAVRNLVAAVARETRGIPGVVERVEDGLDIDLSRFAPRFIMHRKPGKSGFVAQGRSKEETRKIVKQHHPEKEKVTAKAKTGIVDKLD